MQELQLKLENQYDRNLEKTYKYTQFGRGRTNHTLDNTNLWFVFFRKEGVNTIRKLSILLAVLAGFLSIVFWIILILNNPYANSIVWETIIRSFFMMIVPAFLGLAASITNRSGILFVVFIWSLPMSFYLFLTPGIFTFYGLTSIAYLASYLLMRKVKKNETF